MGPITLFDKSFLQSLSVNESVWFDQFFLANVCPLFYVETLADLGKTVQEGRTPEQEVAIIADKFPEMHGSPSANHVDLCIGSLLGHKVPMTGQIQLDGGRRVKSEGKIGLIFEQSPEAEAFSRWQKHEFKEIEHRYARIWREALSTLNLQEVAKDFRLLGIDRRHCKTLEDAKSLAEGVVCEKGNPFDRMNLATAFLNIPPHLRRQILERWGIEDHLPLIEYAPYAAHVLTVEIFFQIALAANLIGSERSSNRVDIAYLFYIPFCMIFVSSDRLHQRCAPLFLRNDQEFVWGHDLKKDLGRLNEYYSRLPAGEKENGVMSFASYPPEEGDFLVAQIWDRHFPKWRERKKVGIASKTFDDSKLVEALKKIADAPTLQPNEVDFDSTETNSLIVRRRMRKMKGSWYQVPKDLKDKKD